MTSATGDPKYVMGRSERETRRLQRQAEVYGPLTRRLFIEAGIGEGMRVLDVGSGGGDVALLLAELVGPTGAVVGIDPNPEILAVARRRANAARLMNVTFLEGDVRSAALEEETFDAAVGRFVLVWVHDPVDVLRASAALVRPRGVVAFQEHDTLGFYRAVPPSDLVERWHRLGASLMDRQGMPRDTAYRLFGSFVAAGLGSPHMRYEAPLGGGPDWVGYEMLASHARSMAPYLVEAGLATWDELQVDSVEERLRAEIVAQQGVLRCLPAIGTWARVQPRGGDQGPAMELIPRPPTAPGR